MNDELRERCVEVAIRIRQRFGRRALHVDSWMTLAGGGDEGLGRVDGSHRPLTEPRDQLRRQGAGTAADVERAAVRRELREVGELRSELPGVHTHEPVVGIRWDFEAHAHPRRRLTPLAHPALRGRPLVLPLGRALRAIARERASVER